MLWGRGAGQGAWVNVLELIRSGPDWDKALLVLKKVERLVL